MDKAGFQECISKLSGGKAPGPDGIENEIIKMLPWEMRDTIHQLFIVMWATGCTPTAWKASDTCLLYKDKGQETDLNAYRPVGLANTIYKLWTSLITRALCEYAEANGMLSNCQAGFRSHRDTTQQLQMLVMALEDAKLAKVDIYALLVDFTSAFNTTCQDKLLWIMHDLGFPTDATDAVRDLYTGATTRFNTPYGHTDPVPVDRGTIQGDSLSPFLFLIYIEPLLRWLQVGARGYKFTSDTNDSAGRFTIGSIDYADDIAILCNSISNLRCQADKLSAYSDWGHLIISHSKTIATAALHKAHQSGRCSTTAEAEKQARRELQAVKLQGKPVTYLQPTAPFTYLGVLLTMTLNWKPQHIAMVSQLRQKLERLRRSFASARQAIHIIKTAIIPSLAYSFCVVPCTPGDLDLYDRAINQCIKEKLRLPLGTTNAVVREDIDKLGLGISSTAKEYHSRNTTALLHSLQSTDTIHAHITRSILHKQITWLYAQAAKHGHRILIMLQHTLRARQLLHATTAQLTATQEGQDLYPKETKLLGQLITQNTSPLPLDIVGACMTCLKSLGIRHATELQHTIAGSTYIISGKMLKERFHNKVKQKHYIALNRLTTMATQDRCPTTTEAKDIAAKRDTTSDLPAAQRLIKPWAAGLTELAPTDVEEDTKHRYADIRAYVIAKKPTSGTQPPNPTHVTATQPPAAQEAIKSNSRLLRRENKEAQSPPTKPTRPKAGTKRNTEGRQIQTIPKDIVRIVGLDLPGLSSWKVDKACRCKPKDLGSILGAMYGHQEAITSIEGWQWDGINKENYYKVHWKPTVIDRWALPLCAEEGYTPTHIEPISREEAKD
ncbi:MAG: RNA-directed DNA polymerase, partial [Agrobacterium sp.]